MLVLIKVTTMTKSRFLGGKRWVWRFLPCCFGRLALHRDQICCWLWALRWVRAGKRPCRLSLGRFVGLYAWRACAAWAWGRFLPQMSLFFAFLCVLVLVIWAFWRLTFGETPKISSFARKKRVGNLANSLFTGLRAAFQTPKAGLPLSHFCRPF